MKLKNIFLTLSALTIAIACHKEPNGGENGPVVEPTEPGILDESLQKNLLFDAQFKIDGTVSDGSEAQRTVQTNAGLGMMTYFNETCGRYVAHFSHPLAQEVSKGFYKLSYSSDTQLQNGLANGHTMELLFRFDASLIATETRIFSADQQGFLVTKSLQGSQLAFQVNLNSASTDPVTVKSGIVPKRGVYYHAVGVWDKSKGMLKIYVNGELKGEVEADGSMVVPSSLFSRWICIGGAPKGSEVQGAFNGDIVLARIFDNPLSDEDVSKLYQSASWQFKDGTMRIDNANYFTEVTLAEGSRFSIVAKGFQEGDKLRMTCGEYSVDLPTVQKVGGATVIIPKGFGTGIYNLFVVRGEEVLPFGSANITISATGAVKAPRIVAHRGYHKNGIPENSMAALKKAQEYKFYGIETDVWMTTDGELYINHDGKLKNVVIQDNTSEVVGALTLNNGERIPTFDQYLAQAATDHSSKLIIEFKDHSTQERNFALVDKILAKVRAAGMDDHVEYIGFNYEVCKKVARERPNAVVGYLSGDREPSEVAAQGINCIDYPEVSLKNHLQWIEDSHNRGMLVNVWTINDTNDLMYWICRGVDYITTDNPDTLQEMIENFF